MSYDILSSNGNNTLGNGLGYTSSNVPHRAYGNERSAPQHPSHASSAPGRTEGLLNASGVSHSALVNSGNAAILGHSSNLNGLKLNSNNNNMTSNLTAAAMGSTYGAVGTTNERLHGQG